MEKPETFKLPPNLTFFAHKYEILQEIGEGTFSKVYKARCRNSGALVAIKAITRTSAPSRIHDELVVLKALNGENNCIKLLDVMRYQDQIIAVFPFVPCTDFKDIILKCTIQDLKKYLYHLIKAVAHMHSKNIIHRDLKPANFLFDLERRHGYLIDFGLAQTENISENQPPEVQSKPMIFFSATVTPSKPPGYYENDSRPVMKASRAGTRGFRAPEVLFKQTNQSRLIDMWSIGVIMLCILTTQYPFFLSMEDIDGLSELGIIFGHAEMRKVAKHYGRVWKSNLTSIKEEGIPFDVLIKNYNPNLELEQSAIDLLSELLDPYDTSRIEADEALNHPFFNF